MLGPIRSWTARAQRLGCRHYGQLYKCSTAMLVSRPKLSDRFAAMFFHGKNLIFYGHIYFLVEYHRLHHPIALVEVISNINHKIKALYTSEVLLLLSLIIILSYSSGKTYHIHHVTL